MKAAAIIVAGGEGVRMRAPINKVFLDLEGRPILERSLDLFEASPFVDEVVVVARAADLRQCEALRERFRKLRAVVAGGGKAVVASVRKSCRAMRLFDSLLMSRTAS